jgi:hypothetical protein
MDAGNGPGQPILEMIPCRMLPELSPFVSKGQGRPKEYDAHHLVPWRHWRAQVARDILDGWGIKINEIENGMWLERTFHRTLSNNHKYMRNVTRRLRKAKGSRSKVLKALDRIRDSLSNSKIPD